MHDRDLRPEPIFSLGEWVRLCVRRPFTIAGVAALGVIVTLVLVGRETPWWKADVTLLLRSEPAHDSAMRALGGWEDRPKAAAELALLSSRDLAERVASVPADGLPPDPAHDLELGLATEVTDASLVPLAGFLRRLGGRPRNEARLVALAEALEPTAPREVVLRFLPEGRVRLSRPGSAGDAVELDWRPGEALSWRGLRLRLRPIGDPTGKTFHVRRHDPDQVPRSVTERTEVFETEPGSGVLRLVFRDTDPHRAAAVANALCQSYLELCEQRVESRSRTAGARIDHELERLESDLDGAQAELVRLQRSNPLTVSMEESAKFLTLQLADLEVEHARAQLRSSLVEQAVNELGQGRLEALSKITESDADKSTRILIEHLAQLSAQAQLQERADSGKLRHVLQLELIELGEERAAMELELAALLRARAVFVEDPTTALGLLGGTDSSSTGIDPMSGILLEKVAHLRARRAELLAGDHLEAHPDVVEITGAIEAHLAQIGRVLERRITTLEGRIEDHDGIAARTVAILEEHPESEEREIAAAMERLGGVVLQHLESLRDATDQSAAAIAGEIADLRGELALLPVGDRELTAPQQIAASAKDRIAELLAAREEARMSAVFAEPPVTIVDLAVPPARRTSPRMGFSLLLGAVLGLALGLVVSWLIDRFARAVEVPEDLRAAGLRDVLASLPHVPAFAAGGLTRVFEAFRGDDSDCPLEDFAGLGFAARHERGGAFVGITSAGASEGKTTAAIAAASVLARTGRRVLLLNAGIKRALWLESADGARHESLLDVVAGSCELDQAVGSSGQRRLDVLSAGVPGALAVDLLARAETRAVLEELAQGYDLVVVDLPSLSVGPQVDALAATLDRVLVVARSRRSARSAVRAAAARLARAGVPVAGGVLNDVRRGPWRRISDRALRRLGIEEDAWLDLGERAA